MGILFLITFCFLRTENGNAENSLPVITFKNSGIIDANNESITTVMPNPITTTATNNNSISSGDIIMEKENLNNLNTLMISAALVRSRREPPITIIKHRSRPITRRPKTRRRIRKPKIRYGPPSYNFGEPLSYYKPGPEISDLDINSYKMENNDHIYDIQNFKKEFGTDFNIQSFKLPAYEKKPIEVNFYGRGGSGRSAGSKKKRPSLPTDSRNFKSTYTPSQIALEEQNYQVPSGEYWEQFEESPAIIPQKSSNIYEIPSENNFPSPPQDSYQLPELDIYQPFSQNSYNHPTQHTYKPQPPNTYQQLPQENFNPERKKFNDPPANIQWSYQTFYDNNPIPDYTSSQLPKPSTESNGEKFNGPKYLPPSEDNFKNFDEPNNSNNGYFAEPPTHYNKYTIPGSDLALPLDESHKSPSYDYPKSSYEVPIYNSIPFNSNDATPVQQVLYPPNDLYRPDYSPSTTTISKESSNKIEITDESHYKNKNMQTFSTSLEELLDPPSDYLENIGTANLSGNRRKRKRTKDSSHNTKQHILDTDELRQAFGSSSSIEQKYKSDSLPEERQIRSNTKKRAPENFVLISSTNIANGGSSGESPDSQKWEPIKIRQNNRENHKNNNFQISKNNNKGMNISSNNKILNTRQIRFERTTEEAFKDIQVISIEKSHSHSYYAGTMSPHELVQKYPGINSREDDGVVYVSSHINVGSENSNDNEKRKGQVFDEELVNRNIPLSLSKIHKNHKYF